MRKQILTLALVIMAIFATNVSAQNASQLIEKYKSMPKAQLHKISGKKLQKQLKKEYSAEDYEILKSLENIELLAVTPTTAQRENILADLKTLEGYTLIAEDAAKLVPDPDKPASTFLTTLEHSLFASQIKGDIYAKGDEQTVSEILLHMNFLGNIILARLSGQIPTSEAGNIVKKVVTVEF